MPKKRPVLTPAQISHLRAQIMHIVSVHAPTARLVLEGKVRWSPQQVALYRTLLGKVLPDLSQSYAQVDVTTRQLTELSREELEQIAAGLHEVEAAAPNEGAIDDEEAQFPALPSPEPRDVVSEIVSVPCDSHAHVTARARERTREHEGG